MEIYISVSTKSIIIYKKNTLHFMCEHANIEYMKEKELKNLQEIFQKEPRVKLAYLFGSQAKETTGPLSDYDFAVYIDSKNPKEIFEIQSRLLDQLSMYLKTDEIDLVILNQTQSPELKYAIILEGILLHEVKPYIMEIEPRILNEYFDFQMVLKKANLL